MAGFAAGRRPPVLVLSVALAVGLLAGCGSAQSAAAPKSPDTVRFAMTSNVAGYWPVFIAQSKGFFSQQRIALDTIVAQTSSRETEALLSGSVDVAAGTPDDMLIALTQGHAVRAVAALRNAPAASLLVGSGVETFAGLKGKRVAVSEVTGSDAYFVRTMLQANGVSPQDVQMVAAGGTPNRAAALLSGAVSAALLDQPQDIQLMDGGMKRLGVTLDYVKDYAWSWLSVEQAHARSMSDVIVRFLRALRQAVSWFYDSHNRAAAASLLAQQLKVTSSVAGRTYDLFVRYRSLAPNLQPSAAGVARLEDAMVEGSRFKGTSPPSPAQFIDTTYLQQAGRSG
jgi:NitT/TauT family transport system substrate-binding protein